jgi:hypothetical protein
MFPSAIVVIRPLAIRRETRVAIHLCRDDPRGARKSTLRRRQRYPQRFGHFVERQVLDVAEHERRSLLGAQPIENDIEPPYRLARLRVQRFYRRFGNPIEARNLKDPPHAPPSKLPLQCANRDREYEASEGVAIAQAPDFREHLKKHFLREVFGTPGGAKSAVHEPKNHRSVLVIRGRRRPKLARDESVCQIGIFREGLYPSRGDAKLGSTKSGHVAMQEYSDGGPKFRLTHGGRFGVPQPQPPGNLWEGERVTLRVAQPLTQRGCVEARSADSVA